MEKKKQLENAVILPRTKMMVESHCSMIKRLYLLPHNRPALDLLIFMLVTSVMTKFDHCYEALINGHKKPERWKSFLSTWKACMRTEVRGEYQTDVVNLMSTISAWVKSQFFICKHIINKIKCPQYHQATINKAQPFVQIDSDSN